MIVINLKPDTKVNILPTGWSLSKVDTHLLNKRCIALIEITFYIERDPVALCSVRQDYTKDLSIYGVVA